MIHPAHHTFLGFSWRNGISKKYYVYTVLPFGIFTAGYIITKLMRVVIEKWRSLGFKAVIFLDDGLGGENSFEKDLYASTFIRKDLESFGFLITAKKCNWFPRLGASWLGLEWDTEKGILSVSLDRLHKAEMALDQIIAKVTNGSVLISARLVAGIVGLLLSMQCVMRNVVRFRSRSLYRCIAGRASWDAPVKVDSNALDELFWRENLKNLNECEFQKGEDAFVSSEIYSNVFVDASGSWGLY